MRQKVEAMEEARDLQEGTHQDSVEVNDLKKKLANLGKEKKDLVEKLTQCLDAMKKTGEMVILTAKGNTVDFVSRFFAPSAGIDEDPVTGSAHSQLIPFWSEKLDKKKMMAKQLSKRGGDLVCEQKNAERVMMGGECVFYMKGEFEV